MKHRRWWFEACSVYAFVGALFLIPATLCVDILDRERLIYLLTSSNRDVLDRVGMYASQVNAVLVGICALVLSWGYHCTREASDAEKAEASRLQRLLDRLHAMGAGHLIHSARWVEWDSRYRTDALPPPESGAPLTLREVQETADAIKAQAVAFVARHARDEWRDQLRHVVTMQYFHLSDQAKERGDPIPPDFTPEERERIRAAYTEWRWGPFAVDLDIAEKDAVAAWEAEVYPYTLQGSDWRERQRILSVERVREYIREQ